MRKNPHHLERRVIIPLFMLIAFLTRVGADLSLGATAVPEEAGFLRSTAMQNWANSEGHRDRHRPIEKRATPGAAAEEEEEEDSRPSPSPTPRSSSAAEAATMPHRATGARKEETEVRARARMVVAVGGDFGGADSVVRRYRFYGRCTGKYVRIYGSRVDGLGGADDVYGELQVESRGSDGGQLTIQGIPSKNYLCFNKKGKLVVKHSARNRFCLFDEIYSSDHYSEFESAANRTWAVGFGKRGQSLPGDRWTRSLKARRCFQFLKMDSNAAENDDGRETGPGSSGGPKPRRHRLQHGGVSRQRKT